MEPSSPESCRFLELPSLRFVLSFVKQNVVHRFMCLGLCGEGNIVGGNSALEVSSAGSTEGTGSDDMADIDVGIIMGSQSDWSTMRNAADVLDELGVSYERKIVSAHRTPERLWEYGRTAVERGLKVIIAGAGGAAHLPGMMASKTRIPIIGVPVQTKALSGVDSLYSIVQMPRGFPVATMAIGETGATNAGLMAVGILATNNAELAKRLDAWRAALSESIPDEPLDD
jgi:5-(carboxyamino)imidazole ribonucleotide mutase